MLDDRLIAIGDIHGCFDELIKLMLLIKPTHKDQFVFLGDYIDRGTQVKEVLDWLIDFKSKHPNTIFLKGNHEDMFLKMLQRKWPVENFIRNGGGTTIKALLENGKVSEKYTYFLHNLDLYYENEYFIFVHAGLLPDITFDELKKIEGFEEILLWIREKFTDSNYNWGKMVVHGHIPTKGMVESYQNRINVDTGCIYGGFLSAVDLTNNIVHTIERIK